MASGGLVTDLHGVVSLGFVFVLHLILSALPFLAAALLAARCGVRGTFALIAIGALALGGVGYLSFWVYLASASAGGVVVIGLTAASIVVTAAAALLPGGSAAVAALRPLALPAALLVVSCALVLCVGYLYGGVTVPLSVATLRFSHELPGDDTLPLILARDVAAHHRPIPRPMAPGGWLSSDRPPLQAGVVLSQWPFDLRANLQLHYEVLSMLLQSQWILGLWALLIESRIPRQIIATSVAVSALAGFVVLNTFYVWPKLMGAAYLMILVAGMLSRRYQLIRARAGWGAVVGGLAAASMLSHEGNAFGLLAVAIVLLLLRRLPSPAFCAAAIGTLVLAMAPWFWYQHFYDPPGDKLLLTQLANVSTSGIPSLHTSVARALVHSYEAIGLLGAVSYKLQNFRQLFGHPTQIVQELIAAFTGPGREAAAFQFRYNSFFAFFPGLGIAAFGPLCLLLLAFFRHGGVRAELLRAAAIQWMTVGVGLVVWCVVMFGPATTVPHQGCYLLELLAFPASMVAWWLVNRPLAYVLAAAQLVIDVVTYGVLTPPRLAGLQPGLDPVLLALSVVLLCALLLTLFWYGFLRGERGDAESMSAVQDY